MKLALLTLGIFCLFWQSSEAQLSTPGIRINVTESGLANAAQLVNLFGKSFVAGKTFPIPPVNKTVLLVEFDFYDIIASQITWSDFKWTTPGNYFEVVLTEFQAQLSLALTVHVLFTSNFPNVTIEISQTNLTVTNTIQNSGGKPLFVVDSVNFDIGKLSITGQGLTVKILQDLEGLIRDLINEVGGSVLVPQVNDALAKLTANLTTTYTLANEVVFDYSLTSNPIISNNNLEVEILGAVSVVGQNIPCPYTPGPITETGTEGVNIYISQAVTDCAFHVLDQSKLLNTVINGYLFAKPPLDNRLGLVIDVHDVPLLQVVPQEGVHVELSFSASLFKRLFQVENFVTLDVDLITDVSGAFVEANSIISIVGKVNSVTPTISVLQTAPDVPPTIANDIHNTNFTLLNERAIEFINQKLPQINELLAQGYALPVIVSNFIQNPQLSFLNNGYLYIGTNIRYL